MAIAQVKFKTKVLRRDHSTFKNQRKIKNHLMRRVIITSKTTLFMKFKILIAIRCLAKEILEV